MGIFIDNIIEDIKRVPTASLIRALFPSHPVPQNARLMRSPFHTDSHPSFSCFLGKNGYYLWKDHSTGESGDNITLYRKVYPTMSYVQAVDSLAFLFFGKHASRTATTEGSAPLPLRVTFPTAEDKAERQGALNIVKTYPLNDSKTPIQFREYCRNRGISDSTADSMGLQYVLFENLNRKGKEIKDSVSGLPITEHGKPVYDKAINEAIGMYNDIGGIVLRVPDTPERKGFKGATSSFISTYLADNSRPIRNTRFEGKGENNVSLIRYDEDNLTLRINPTQYFSPVARYAAPYFTPLVAEHLNRNLSDRDINCLCAVADTLNSPIVNEVVVVEGMFDGLSEREINRCHEHLKKGRDLIIANSISNLRWAVPFICRHKRACIMLDNDIKSGAGEKAAMQLVKSIADYGAKCQSRTQIINGSSLFEGYKDLNEALMASKGFPVKQTEIKKTNIHF